MLGRYCRSCTRANLRVLDRTEVEGDSTSYTQRHSTSLLVVVLQPSVLRGFRSETRRSSAVPSTCVRALSSFSSALRKRAAAAALCCTRAVLGGGTSTPTLSCLRLVRWAPLAPVRLIRCFLLLLLCLYTSLLFLLFFSPSFFLSRKRKKGLCGPGQAEPGDDLPAHVLQGQVPRQFLLAPRKP